MISSKPAGLALFFIAVLSIQILCPTGVSGGTLGICYGHKGDNLPSPSDTVALIQRIQVKAVRMYEPFADMLDALRGSGIAVAFGPRNEELQAMAQDLAVAAAFVQTWILPYRNNVDIKWITLGNEIIPGEIGPHVPGAIRNMNAALANAGVSGIAVTTVLSGAPLTNTFPPSKSEFVPEVAEIMKEITSMLQATNSPLMVNVYPYFAYASSTTISVEYATFGLTTPVMTDEVSGLAYFNLFEAMVDGFYAALEKIGGGEVKVVVAESGWPTRGNGQYTSVEIAKNYNVGLKNFVAQGKTPRRQNTEVDAFVFAMFNENQKQGEVEQNFGLFYPDMSPVYDFGVSDACT